MNLFYEAFPELEGAAPGTCGTGAVPPQPWPPVPGEYFVLCEHKTAHVAVSTLASIVLAEELARLAPRDLCMVGKTETENIGIEKVIQNTITNPSIHYLIVAGKDPEGHRSGATLLSLCEGGVDRALRVIGSPGRRPVLKNVTPEEVEAFRSQVTLVDMIGCEDAAEVVTRIGALSRSAHLSCSGKEFARVVKPVKISAVEVIRAEKVKKTELDKGGYFVILPLKEKGSISVEHYSNDNRFLRIIEGTDAVSLYRTIVANGWVTQLSHAAYLGKELDRAELSMKLDFKYVQDGA